MESTFLLPILEYQKYQMHIQLTNRNITAVYIILLKLHSSFFVIIAKQNAHPVNTT